MASWRVTFPFRSCGLPGACALLSWVRNNSRMHNEIKSSYCRQWDTFGNVLFVNLESYHLRECYFMWMLHTTYIYNIADHVHPSWKQDPLMAIHSFSPATLQEFKNCIRKQQRVWGVEIASKFSRVFLCDKTGWPGPCDPFTGLVVINVGHFNSGNVLLWCVDVYTYINTHRLNWVSGIGVLLLV